jgi:hypothetical protein
VVPSEADAVSNACGCAAGGIQEDAQDVQLVFTRHSNLTLREIPDEAVAKPPAQARQKFNTAILDVQVMYREL